MVKKDFHLSPEACRRLSEYLAHFSSPLRLRIICQLSKGEKCVSELMKATGGRQSTVSGQLKYLTMVGITAYERRGVNIHYRIADERALQFLRFLVKSFEPDGVLKW